MSARLPCPPAPGPLEEFAVQCDSLFQTLAQRHGFRTYPAFQTPPDGHDAWFAVAFAGKEAASTGDLTQTSFRRGLFGTNLSRNR